MVVLGYESAIPVTMEDCISHCKAVEEELLILDYRRHAFGSYQVSNEEAVKMQFVFLKKQIQIVSS